MGFWLLCSGAFSQLEEWFSQRTLLRGRLFTIMSEEMFEMTDAIFGMTRVCADERIAESAGTCGNCAVRISSLGAIVCNRAGYALVCAEMSADVTPRIAIFVRIAGMFATTPGEMAPQVDVLKRTSQNREKAG